MLEYLAVEVPAAGFEAHSIEKEFDLQAEDRWRYVGEATGFLMFERELIIEAEEDDEPPDILTEAAQRARHALFPGLRPHSNPESTHLDLS